MRGDERGVGLVTDSLTSGVLVAAFLRAGAFFFGASSDEAFLTGALRREPARALGLSAFSSVTSAGASALAFAAVLAGALRRPRLGFSSCHLCPWRLMFQLVSLR